MVFLNSSLNHLALAIVLVIMEWDLEISKVTVCPLLNRSTSSNNILPSLYFKGQGAFSKIGFKSLNGANDMKLLELQLFNAALIVLLRSCTLPSYLSIRWLIALKKQGCSWHDMIQLTSFGSWIFWNRRTPSSFLRRSLSAERLEEWLLQRSFNGEFSDRCCDGVVGSLRSCRDLFMGHFIFILIGKKCEKNVRFQ